MEDGINIMEHLNIFKELLNQFGCVAVIAEEEDQALLLLTSLSDSFEHMITTVLYGKDTLQMGVWERGDRGVEEVSTEIRNQGARNDALSRPDCAPGRPPGRPACTNVHRKEAVDRPFDRLKAGLLSVGPGRPARSTAAWVGRPAGRPTCAFGLSF